MNAFGFNQELERTLVRAAETLALARQIEETLAGIGPGAKPGCLWRRGG